MEHEQLGRYQVLSPIGHGGMGAVYLGEHELLRHQVAIKILHERHIHNPAMERRFYNEARAIAALDHPGIVKLFDIGRAGDGRAYVVMELLRGETLRTRISTRGMPRASVLSFALQIASALAAAHQKGIVHRDLKPENVFIVRDPDIDSGERVKILDFGIAKRTRINGTPSPEITRTGVLVGTPSYMAPEQCRGDDEIDARADIYSFGILLYEMLSGVLPFASTDTEEILAKQLYCAPRPLAQLAPGLPPSVIEVVDRCLAKSPNDRYPTMAEVSAALRSLAPTEEREISTAPRIPELGDDSDSDFAELETLPGRSVREDQTTGVVITSLRTRLRPPPRRHTLVIAAGAAVALAALILVVRGLVGGHSRTGIRAKAAPVPSAVISVADSADDEATEPSPPPSATVHVRARPPAVAQADTPEPKHNERPAPAHQRTKAKPAKRSRPSRAARRAPTPRPAPAKRGDRFAEIETPTVF